MLIFRNPRTFKSPLPQDALDRLAKKNFSKKTCQKIKWICKIFWEWRNFCNETNTSGELIMCDLEDVDSISIDSLNFGLVRFLTEIKKINGDEYPAKTMYEILICVQFHLETLGFPFNFLQDDRFMEVKFTLDNIMKDRTERGIGTKRKQAEVFTKLHEDILWELGIVGLDTPEQLRNAVFLSLGLGAAMRAGNEHHSMRAPGFDSQLSFHYDEMGNKFVRYSKDRYQKTNCCGLKHR